jgi:hypothetical protein
MIFSIFVIIDGKSGARIAKYFHHFFQFLSSVKILPKIDGQNFDKTLSPSHMKDTWFERETKAAICFGMKE